MMDLTPLEVRKKKGDFRRPLRGYDPGQVDDFLDLVADRLEQLVRESVAHAERYAQLEQQVAEFRERERALTEALVSAQAMREGMKEQAAREVGFARERAEHEAARIKMDAVGAREREEESLKRLVIRKAQFIQAFRTFLERELAELGAAERTLEAELMRTDANVATPSSKQPPPAEEAAPAAAPAKETRASAATRPPPARRVEKHAPEKHVPEKPAPEKPAPESSVVSAPKPEPRVTPPAPKAEARPAARPTPPRRAPVEPPRPRPEPPRAKPDVPAAAAPAPVPPAQAAAPVPPLPTPPSPPPKAASTSHSEWDFAIDEEEIKAAGQNGRTTPEPGIPAATDKTGAGSAVDKDLLALENALGGGADTPEPFDFDAAIANATGFATDSELLLSEEEIVPAESVPPVDTAGKTNDRSQKSGKPTEGTGEFDIDDFGAPPPGPSGPPPLWKPGTPRPQELTVRPLSSEEDAPDLPARKQKPEDDMDDMLKNLFGDGH